MREIARGQKTTWIRSEKKFKELQGGDLNPRPPGYEPDELPGCSTLRQESLSSTMVEEGLEPSHLFTGDGF